ncbi:GNAT family N-acetyltransferase [Bacteroidota bacterium]
MIILDKLHYRLVLEPLKKLNINTLFAQSVVKQHVAGKIYIDDFAKPSAFYIVHPYGMTLLFGDLINERFENEIVDYLLNIKNKRKKAEYLQVYPESCNSKLLKLLNAKADKKIINLSEKIEKYSRANFQFNNKKYQDFKEKLISQEYKIIRTDKDVFNSMQGIVIPKYFWNNAEEFLSIGAGFTLILDGKPASTAYSAYVHDDMFELGIETMAEYRGKGYAKYVCSALIDYALERNLIPVWSCRKENVESFSLAQKLGFEPTLFLPYYTINI